MIILTLQTLIFSVLGGSSKSNGGKGKETSFQKSIVDITGVAPQVKCKFPDFL